uniref:Peroxisomal 2,4-dienoyl-CoA reductase [(3E)-enoyl-CoA-producing] n=1 Tax=Ornithorhynchus anatinus TaxID=9258 RepID=A0A6I8NXJ8_ORNAN
GLGSRSKSLGAGAPPARGLGGLTAPGRSKLTHPGWEWHPSVPRSSWPDSPFGIPGWCAKGFSPEGRRRTGGGRLNLISLLLSRLSPHSSLCSFPESSFVHFNGLLSTSASHLPLPFISSLAAPLFPPAHSHLSLLFVSLCLCSLSLSLHHSFLPFQAAEKLSVATGQRCLPLSLDVRQPQTIAVAVDTALKELGRVDILINGAAGNFLCPAKALSFNAYKTVIDIDTIGTFNASKVLFEKWFQDHGGVIINITATLSFKGQALQVHAGTAKAAVDAMTRHLAVEWGPYNVRVNSLAPGPISGTEGMRRLGGSQTHLSRAILGIPLQRLGNKTEIAHSALYLASPLASYVTGASLVVDGGSWLTSPNGSLGRSASASFSAKL